MGHVVRVFCNSADVSASTKLETTCLIVLHSVTIRPLWMTFLVRDGLLLRGKRPASLVRVLGRTRYAVSESICRIMLLARKRIITFGW